MITIPDETNTAFVNAECIAIYIFYPTMHARPSIAIRNCVEVRGGRIVFT